MEKNLGPGTQNSNYSYRNLLLWQKAQALALEIIRTVTRLRRDPAAQVIGRQIIGAASSMPLISPKGTAGSPCPLQFERMEKSKSNRLSEELSPYTPNDYVAGRF